MVSLRIGKNQNIKMVSIHTARGAQRRRAGARKRTSAPETYRAQVSGRSKANEILWEQHTEQANTQKKNVDRNESTSRRHTALKCVDTQLYCVPLRYLLVCLTMLLLSHMVDIDVRNKRARAVRSDPCWEKLCNVLIIALTTQFPIDLDCLEKHQVDENHHLTLIFLENQCPVFPTTCACCEATRFCTLKWIWGCFFRIDVNYAAVAANATAVLVDNIFVVHSFLLSLGSTAVFVSRLR